MDKLNLVGVGEERRQAASSRPTETIQDASYYLARPLFMYPSDKALERPEVAAFMEFVVNNSQTIAEAAKIVPMTDEQAIESKDEVARAGRELVPWPSRDSRQRPARRGAGSI